MPQAFDEYVKAWFACKVLAKEYGLGGMDGFQFNMSVGYDLEGIKTEKIDRFIEGMKDASETPIFKECRQWLLENLDRFENLTEEDVKSISPNVCGSITLSTLHGCPPQEIERIARYLLEEKNVHTFIKCNPTLLGYEYARKLMDDMGYDYVAFGDFHFKDDLQYSDAVPMLQRLQALADEKGLEFGVKITNTFPVDVKQNELPSEEMYMSGKSLYALSMSVARKLAEDFEGKLRISYSGGADYFNIEKIVDAGIWPVTMATTMLKPGGYERLVQIGGIFAKRSPEVFEGVDREKVAAMVEAAKTDKHHVKAVKPLPSRKVNRPVPLTDCFIAPCQEGCPIHQDITRYLQLAGEGKYEEALRVILNKNPLPFITGTICAHNCMSKCTRNFYEKSVNIRRTKLESAEGGFEAVMADFTRPEITSDKTVAVVGGGPAGLAAAYFLARGGMRVTIIEKEESLGGVVRNIIPGFRISHEAIDKAVKLIEAMGAAFIYGREIKDIKALKEEDVYKRQEYRWVVGIQVGEVANYSACQGTYACLNENVGGALTAVSRKLLACFHCHGSVALHNPGRNLLVAIPGSILNDNASRCLVCFLCSQTHAVIIVHFLNVNLSAFLCNVLQTCLCGALWHMYHSLLSQAVCSPGNAAAVISVCGGEKGGLTELFSQFIGGENAVGQFGHILSCLLCNVAGHGEGAAQHFEGIEAEAVGLILYIDLFHPEISCHVVKLCKGRLAVLRKALMEGAGLLDFL